MNVSVDTLDSIAFTDYFLGRFGMEPKVQSAIAVTDNGMVGPVKGANGVYMVQVDGKTPRENEEETVKNQLEQAYRSKVRALTQVLRDNAKITDQRNKFF